MSIAEESEILTQSEDLPWATMGDGVSIRVLRVSEETGLWSALIRMEPGAVFAAHKHLGAAEFFILKGCLQYRMGDAQTGSYGYEPLGAVHDATTCSEETILYFTSYGPVVFHDDEGTVTQILSYETALQMRAGARENFTAERAKPAA
jgi:anti-sigma factor ChrR (cupin superfamily)